MEKMVCPICSEEFDGMYVEYLDNGNPVCPRCVEDEDKKKESKNEKNY